MPAGVHLPRIDGGEPVAGVLLDRESVHVRPKEEPRPPATPTFERSHHPRPGDSRLDLISSLPQPLRYDPGRAMLLEPGFRVSMEVATRCDQELDLGHGGGKGQGIRE
jgi:hypothetical protein